MTRMCFVAGGRGASPQLLDVRRSQKAASGCSQLRHRTTTERGLPLKRSCLSGRRSPSHHLIASADSPPINTDSLFLSTAARSIRSIQQYDNFNYSRVKKARFFVSEAISTLVFRRETVSQRNLSLFARSLVDGDISESERKKVTGLHERVAYPDVCLYIITCTYGAKSVNTY